MIISNIIKKIVKKDFLQKNKLNFINDDTNNDIISIQNKSNCDSSLIIPSTLKGFINIKSENKIDKNGRNNIYFYGQLELTEEDYKCPNCGHKMHIKNGRDVDLKHLSFGMSLTHVCFNRKQLKCNNCKHTQMQNISFKNPNHFITIELEQYIKDLLTLGTYTNIDVSYLTGVGRNIIKDIDLQRLKDKYTIDGKTLIIPDKPSRVLGIDEFKLHNGYKYASHIIDIETGHILWIQEGKGKKIVHDFIEHVGLEWMKNVEAVACDMNAGFEHGFKEKCPHINIVFDHFHIVKNFNDIVVTKVYREEQSRLRREKRYDEANTLKKSKYILTSSIETLQKKDEDARKEKIIKKGSDLFKIPEIKRKSGYEDKYKTLISENELLFTIDLVKEKLKDAYKSKNSKIMKKKVIDIVDICNQTENKNFKNFGKLLFNHIDGISNYADYHISSGKIEGINNKIKTVRRMHYGIPDNEYFFLKLFDVSRTKKRNNKSPKKNA